MENIDESFELLSSMSPKVDKMKKRVPKRANTVLALKKNFRRSSIYDHAKLTIKNESLVLIEASSTDTSPSETPGKNININTTSVIVISDTDLSVASTSFSSKGENNNGGKSSKELSKAESPEQLTRRSASAVFISETKKIDIESWIDSVAQTADNDTKFSELSIIESDYYIKEGSKQAVSSTFVDSASRRFDELFKPKQVDDKQVSSKIYNRCGTDTSSEESFHLQLTSGTNICTNEPCSDENTSSDHKKVVENDVNLSNLSIDDSLDRNTNMKQKSPRTKADIQNNYKYRYRDNIDVEVNKKSDIENIENSRRLNGSYSESDEVSSEKDVIESSACSENEVHSMLDELYGNSWRDKKHSILPQSERKPKSSLKDKITIEMPKTEQRPKQSLLYKNPYVQSEKKNSNNLLQTLQKARMKAALESPWASKLKSLCDTDSSLEESDEHKLQPIKLNFENDTETRCSVSKENEKIVNGESTDESDKENFSDDPDWGQSLEERLKKKHPLIESVPKHVNDANQNRLKEPLQGKVKNKKTKANKQIDLLSVSSDDEPVTKMELNTGKKLDGTYTFLASLSSNVPITKCDMSARIFRNNFKKFKDDLARRLFNLFNEKVFDNALPKETEIKWNDRLRGTAGRCDCVKVTRRTGAVERTAKILLASKILDKPDRLRDTLIHEMCHAATWIVNQISDGHGHFWQSWAHKAMKTFPELPPIKRCHDYVINTKYTYRCTGCGYSIGRHSKSLDIERKKCGYCYGKFEVLLNKISKKGELTRVPVTPRKQPTGFALFVKDNYAVHKSHQLTHAEVMKLLGQKFAELKTD